MTLTNIVQQKRNEENVNLYLDNKYWVSLSKNQMIEFKLVKNLKIDEQQKFQIEQASTANKIKEKVTAYVFQRPRSIREVKDYLRRKFLLEDPELSDVINNLESQGLVDDTKFAAWFAEQRTSYGIHGENKIRAELSKKGVAKSIVTDLFDHSRSEEEIEKTKEKIEKYTEKIIGKIKHKNKYELKAKLSARLAARGFKFDEFKELVNEKIKLL